MIATGTSVSLLKFVGTVSLGLLTVRSEPIDTSSLVCASSDVTGFYPIYVRKQLSIAYTFVYGLL
jgi:hypothetical protein